MKLDRRTALVTLGTMCSFLYGKPVKTAQGSAIQLPLDSVDAIIVQYRGRRVVVSPAELIDALSTASAPMQMQQMRK